MGDIDHDGQEEKTETLKQGKEILRRITLERVLKRIEGHERRMRL